LAPCKKLLRVEVELEKVQAAFEEVTKSFQRDARLPGFRPGKAPKDMVAKRYEAEILDEAKKKVISEAYRAAVYEQKLQVVTQPDIEEIQFSKDQPTQFAATIETAPEFELPDYKGLTVKRQIGSVTDEDVARAIDMLREQRAEYPVVARELNTGDVAVVNYTGTCEGKPLTDFNPTAKGLTEKKAFWVRAEPNSFIPGFSEQILGMKAGEKRSINIDFPADFVVSQVGGKKGIYEVELVEVREKKAPEANDEFAKALGAESFEKLREGVRADLQNELNSKQTRDMRNQVVKALLDKIQCDLPDSLVVEETRSIIYNIVSENQRRGVPKEAMDAQKDAIYNNANATAKERVKAMFLMHRIAEKEGTRVEQLELANRLQAMADQYNMPFKKLVDQLEKSNNLQSVHEQVLTDKVIDLLLLNAKVEDVQPTTPIIPPQPAS
jgi:trigger factor